MDPNVTLARIRELTLTLIAMGLTLAEEDELGELICALDDWLSHGGAFPADWMDGR